jgi:heterogeneous nuclear ribonucleoprotein A1/A3
MKTLTSILAAAALSLGLASAAVANPHHGYHGGFGGGYGAYGLGAYGAYGLGAYGAYGLQSAFGGQICVEPTTGQQVLCSVASPFFGYGAYGLNGRGYGFGGHRGYRHH